MPILNLTGHPQEFVDVSNPNRDDKIIEGILSFTGPDGLALMPSVEAIQSVVSALVERAETIFATDWGSEEVKQVLIAGPGFLTAPLDRELRSEGFIPLYEWYGQIISSPCEGTETEESMHDRWAGSPAIRARMRFLTGYVIG